VSDTTYDYVKGEATKAYDTTKLSKWTRQFVYLKPGIFVIFDNVITTSSSYQKKWNIVPATLPEDQGGGVLKITNGAGALWIKKLLPVGGTVTFFFQSDFSCAKLTRYAGLLLTRYASG